MVESDGEFANVPIVVGSAVRGRSICCPFAFYDSVSPAVIEHTSGTVDGGRQSTAAPTSGVFSCGC